MRVFVVVFAVSTLGLSQVSDEKKPAEKSIAIDDPAVIEVLEKIHSVSPYEVPNLGLREDANYASTSEDLAPFGGVKPFKEHFLLQMEYTGPGRAIPEPEDIDSVKLGFIGPIMATVSVATGGRSHEEPLGIQMLRGCPTCRRGG